MGFESFNAPPPEQELDKKILERIPPEPTPVQEKVPPTVEPSADHEGISLELPTETPLPDIKIAASQEPTAPKVEQISQPEEKESIEDTRFIRESLESVSDSIDRVGWALKDRSDRGLNEFYSPNIRERLGISARALREVAAAPEFAKEDAAAALDSVARTFEDFGSQQSPRSLREDSESLRRLGSSVRLAQDSLLTLSSRLVEHQENDFQNITKAGARARDKMEDAMAVIARRHAAVDRYLGRR